MTSPGSNAALRGDPAHSPGGLTNTARHSTALVVDVLEGEDGQRSKEDHEADEDADDVADPAVLVAEGRLQIAGYGRGAAAWDAHLHSTSIISY